MAFYAVSYDLHRIRDYPRIHKGVTDISVNWCKPLNTFYILESNKTAIQVRDFLNNYLDSDDSIFVIEVNPPFNWAAKNIPDGMDKWLG